MAVLFSTLSTACKQNNESTARLVQFAQEINNAPDINIDNGTVLTGCKYSDGDTVFAYLIKVNDNRYDKIEEDSIKRAYTNTLKSEGMAKIVNLTHKANVGLEYRLTLPEKEVSIVFSSSEISSIKDAQAK